MGKFKLAVWNHWSHLEREESLEDAVRGMVRRLAGAGFEIIIPCVKLPSALVNYPSRIAKVTGGLESEDALKALLEEAASQKIKVHPWFCVFPEGEGSRLLEEHPEYAAVDKEGKIFARRWACAVRSEVADYEFSLMQEVMDNYSPTGIHLDYIRTGDVCYCDHCREHFKAAFGTDPKELDSRHPLWGEFLEWRAAAVTGFVERVRRETKTRGLELSAAVFQDYPRSFITNGQDWADWGRRNLVDFLFPMIYTNSVKVVRAQVVNHLASVEAKTPIWAGLGLGSSSSRLTLELLIEEVKAAVSAGAEGIVIFDYRSLEDEHLKALQELAQ